MQKTNAMSVLNDFTQNRSGECIDDILQILFTKEKFVEDPKIRELAEAAKNQN